MLGENSDAIVQCDVLFIEFVFQYRVVDILHPQDVGLESVVHIQLPEPI